MGDAQAHEGEDAQVRIQQLPLFEHNLLVFAQELIKLADEVRENLQKHLIKALIELLALAVHLHTLGDVQPVLALMLRCLLTYKLLKAVHIVDIIRLPTEQIAQILFFDAIGFLQVLVGLTDDLSRLLKLMIALTKQSQEA